MEEISVLSLIGSVAGLIVSITLIVLFVNGITSVSQQPRLKASHHGQGRYNVSYSRAS
jgi:hypothetical protein